MLLFKQYGMCVYNGARSLHRNFECNLTQIRKSYINNLVNQFSSHLLIRRIKLLSYKLIYFLLREFLCIHWIMKINEMYFNLILIEGELYVFRLNVVACILLWIQGHNIHWLMKILLIFSIQYHNKTKITFFVIYYSLQNIRVIQIVYTRYHVMDIVFHSRGPWRPIKIGSGYSILTSQNKP